MNFYKNVPSSILVSEQYVFDPSNNYELIKPDLLKLKHKAHKSLKNLIMYFIKDRIYFGNIKVRCPRCGSIHCIKDGFYHGRKLYFADTGKIEVSVQFYECKSCNKRFQADLSEIVDKNCNYTKEVRAKAEHLVSNYLGSLYDVVETFKQIFGLSISHQSIENWLFTPDTFLTYGEGRYSGYYLFDVQWVKVKGRWNYRHTLMDAVSKEVIADKVYVRQEASLSPF